MSTELAPVMTGLAGDRKEIAATVDRIKVMTTVPKNAPDFALWALGQMSVAMDLSINNGEIYLGEFKGKFLPIVGVNGYAKEARKQSEFQHECRPLDTEEMKQHLGSKYKEGDYGVEIMMWNYMKARSAKEIGIPYKPVKTYGFWTHGDNIPKTWTKIMVAEKRALKTALRQDFSFRSFEERAQQLGGATSDEFSGKVYDVIDGEFQKEEKRTAPIAEAAPLHEEDDILFATAPSTEPLADVKTLDDVDELPFGAPESDTEEEEAIAEDPMRAYHDLWLNPEWELADAQTPIFTNLRNADKEGRRCTPKGYGQMVGRLNQNGIGDDFRRQVLAVLFGRTITKDTRPSSAAAKSLHEWLDPDKGDAVVKDLVQNAIPLAIGKFLPDYHDLWETPSNE